MRTGCPIAKDLLYASLLLGVWLMPARTARADAQPLLYYIQLIRGTDQEHREAAWKPIGPKLSSRLSPIFRWKKYWEVHRQAIAVEKSKISRCRLSNEREVEIEPIGPPEMELKEIEIKVYLNGHMAEKSRQPVSAHMTIVGGERTPDDCCSSAARRSE